MRVWRSVMVLLTLIMILGSLSVAEPGLAQGNPLPALPGRSILDQIIKDTGGATFTPLLVPDVISGQFVALATALNPTFANNAADKIFDIAHPVYYTTLDAGLKRIAIPVVPGASLTPDITAPDGLPAKLIGAQYDFQAGATLLVVVWKDKDKTKKPAELRAYTLQNATLSYTTPYKLNYRKLKGNKAGKIAPNDQGVVIAVRETCYTLGQDQVCFAADKQAADKSALTAASAASDQLTKAYTFKAKIDTDGAITEVAGTDWRKQCSDQLAQTTDIQKLAPIPECAATIVFAGISNAQAGDPVGLIQVIKDIKLAVYDTQGNKVDTLPAGTYLVLDATPDVTDPGAAGVLFLVNADGKNHYLLPSQVVEGFGESADKTSNGWRGQAGIKDARIGVHDFG